MVLTFMARSPWEPGFLAPVAARFVTTRLDLSVGRPGPRDFAVRIGAVRPHEPCASPTRPSHPGPRVVTTRDPPLLPGQDGADHTSDFTNLASAPPLRHPGATGNLRMARMRQLPVVQRRLIRASSCSFHAVSSAPSAADPTPDVSAISVMGQLDMTPGGLRNPELLFAVSMSSRIAE
jgi:hypothetical protein